MSYSDLPKLDAPKPIFSPVNKPNFAPETTFTSA